MYSIFNCEVVFDHCWTSSLRPTVCYGCRTEICDWRCRCWQSKAMTRGYCSHLLCSHLLILLEHESDLWLCKAYFGHRDTTLYNFFHITLHYITFCSLWDLCPILDRQSKGIKEPFYFWFSSNKWISYAMCQRQCQDKKLSYRRETARQLPTWSGLAPLPLLSLWLHLCVWSNPKLATNVRRFQRPHSGLKTSQQETPNIYKWFILPKTRLIDLRFCRW